MKQLTLFFLFFSLLGLHKATFTQQKKTVSMVLESIATTEALPLEKFLYFLARGTQSTAE